MQNIINYLLSIPFFGVGGRYYFGHEEDISSAVARLGYDAKLRTLDVHFVRSRATYRYFEVGLLTVIRLATARSLGEAINRLIVHAPVKGVAMTWSPRAVVNNNRRKQLKRALKKGSLSRFVSSPRQLRKRIKALNKLFGWS